MRDWKRSLLTPDTAIIQAIEVIDSSQMGIVIIVNQNGCLCGTVTDGDIRRAILRRIPLTEPIEKIMNKNPIVAKAYETRETMLAVMRDKQVNQIPIVDENNKVISVEVLNDLIKSNPRDNWVVLMAGGLGQRLRPLTSECPKPLLKIGDKPILETIIQNFMDYGFHKFYISVNYKAEMIEEYFGDGINFGVQIEYLRENERLGTAGALSLLPKKPQESFIVMNGDLLTKVNFQQLLNFHQQHQSKATMCVREYKYEVPYGVVQIDKHRLIGITEKPVEHHFVSAGVYAIEPEVLDWIPKRTYYDMPSLFEALLEKKAATSVFPVREYWVDIGRMSDFEQANAEFREVFR